MKLKKLFTATLITSTLVFATNALAAPDAAVATTFNPEQVQQIQQVIHEYLLQNPQLMVEVIKKLQAQQENQMETQALGAIKNNAKALFNDQESPVYGNKNAAVTIVEFFDYQCPHCKDMAKTIEGVVKQDPNLKIVFKEFPIFPGSMFAAQAALAANMQGKYWEFHNALMGANNPLTKDDVLAIAKRVGLNMPQLEKDMDSSAIKNELQQNQQLAQNLGLEGTPAFIVQSNKDENKTFFIPGQVSDKTLTQFIQKAS